MSRFFIIPIADDGNLLQDLQICETKGVALETAIKSAGRHAGLVIAEEREPDEELELVRIIGRVTSDVLDRLLA